MTDLTLVDSDDILITDRVETSYGCPTSWEMKAEFLSEPWTVDVHYRYWRLTVTVTNRQRTIRECQGTSDGCASWDDVESYVRAAIADAALEIKAEREDYRHSLIAA
jgi:hypothetical protein